MPSKKEIEAKDKQRLQRLAAIIIAAGALFSIFTFYGYQLLFADNLLVDKADRVLYISKSSTYKSVSDTLEKYFLHDRLSYHFVSKLMGLSEKIQAGRYEIHSNTSNFELMRKLIKGKQDPVKFTVVNVRTVGDLAKRMSKKIDSDSASIHLVLTNSSLAAKYGLNDTTLITLFIPNTYEIYWTYSPEKIVELMKEENSKFWNEDRISKAAQIGLTPTQVYIMASIVEAETHKDDEKRRIAGVYMNRYLAQQRLQADPTLIFGTGDFGAKRVNKYHRYHKNPYNTYRKKGLPPGPINIPSVASIDAVLQYEPHDYFFFCARPDLSGYHLFSKTFEDHLKVAQSYWQTLDKENIH